MYTAERSVAEATGWTAGGGCIGKTGCAVGSYRLAGGSYLVRNGMPMPVPQAGEGEQYASNAGLVDHFAGSLK